MKYECPLLVVKDIEKAKRFYQEVLGCHVALDFGANVTFSCGLALQTEETWSQFINVDVADIKYRSLSSEIYFEEDDYQKFLVHLETFPDIRYVHGVIEHDWGQRVIRFFDPDGHIIEVGESMEKVIKRFLSLGMSIEDTAKRSLYPISIIRKYAKELEE